MKIHFIGICGVAMSALAIALQEDGHHVTGSDAGFYPPVPDNLKKHNIHFYPGWHVDKMTAHGEPDLVVVGNVASSNNPEWIYTKVNNLNYKSYPEVLREFFIKSHSIVVAGTYGKTTSSTLLSWILTRADMDPSYMFGGISLNDLPPAKIGSSAWSIVEGDEYKTSRWDEKAKFYHYNPTHLLLTAVIWDHADVYATEESYISAFQDLYDMTPPSGQLVISESVSKILDMKGRDIITYGSSMDADYRYSDIILSSNGLSMHIHHDDVVYPLESIMIGDYMADNIAGCFAMAHRAGISPAIITKSVREFGGIRRRLEKRLTGPVTVFDDIAHSPTKSAAILQSLKKIYHGKITAIFEPNTGNRRLSSIPQYEFAFKNADEVIIPRLTKLKIDQSDPEQPMGGKELRDVINKSHNQTLYIEDDSDLIRHITRNRKAGDVIVFLGSHGFRGMIEDTVEILQRNK
jgi:UDP-N-acetylmuramate: L-alanyl-gamma-D-glutamyl-meso-diaminopimelate ligase